MTILTMTMRPYAGEADLQPIVDLIQACDAVDKLEDGKSVDELRQELTNPELDPARDVALWEADGVLVGYGQMWIPQQGSGENDGFLWFKVHPDARGDDLETQIIAWGEERMRLVSDERGIPVKLYMGARESHTSQRELLEQHGYSVTRSFYRMERSLVEPIPELQMPAGFTLHTLTEHDDLQQWADMFNQSFIDHWNHHPLTVEHLEHEHQRPDYRYEHDLIAVAPDGTFAAFCYCPVNPEENARTGRDAGWIAALGTRRGFRKIGLGRAMLLAGLHRLKAEGLTTALLGVDTHNPSGALGLYTSVGFEVAWAQMMYSKELASTDQPTML